MSCLAIAAAPKDWSVLVLIIYLCGRFCAALSANTCWLYTAELYPTNLRGQALGTCSMISRIFGTTSSFVGELASVWKPLPMIVLGVPSLLAATLLAPR